jgi:hypothetical protein
LYVSSSNIDTDFAFSMVTILNGQTTFSGEKFATLGVYFSFNTTFTGDGITTGSLIIDMSNTNDVIIALGSAIFDFFQVPIVAVGETDGQVAPLGFVVNGDGVSIPLTQLSAIIQPANGAPPQRYVSQYVSTALGSYYPQTITT